MKCVSIIFMTFFILGVYVNAQSNLVDTYVNEFNNENEKCQPVDYFVYDLQQANFWTQNHYIQTFPVFYKCCDDKNCITLVFDIKNKKFFDDVSSKELIDLNFIKNNLNSRNISEQHFITKGIDVCESFGGKRISQETLNLATEATQKITPLMEAKTAQNVKAAISISKGLGFVSEFNAGVLVTSVACHYNNKILKSAVENLEMCNYYLSNIRNNYAKAGYVNSLNSQIYLTKSELKEYLDSLLSMTRGVVGFLANTFSGIMSMPERESKGDYSLTIEKTEYQVAQDVYGEIVNYNSYLYSPESTKLINNQKSRILEKEKRFIEEYDKFNSVYKNISVYVPMSVSIFLKNIFLEPNSNYSDGLEYYKNSTYFLELSKDLYFASRYNSAQQSLIYAEINLNLSKEIIIRENNIERHFDKRWIVFLIIVGFILAFFLFKN